MPDSPIPPIRLVARTPASPAVAWTWLTDAARVREWLTSASPVGDVGDPYVLDFGDGSIVQGAIVGVEEGRTFAHRWGWLDQAPIVETLVTWTVRPAADGGSEIELLHDGWEEAGSDIASRDDHEHYWQGYVDDLRERLEHVSKS
jgi:uncharacterized protein YndB with AHSA1/START domain